MKTREQIMREAMARMTKRERAIAQQIRRETVQHLKEREPERVRIAYGTSTPWYYAEIEVGKPT